MKIEIQIPGISQIAEAIVKLADAIKSHGRTTISPITVTGSTSSSVTTVQATTSEEKPSTNEAPKKELTSSQKRKNELSEQIKALGGTPPEKGSVAKYEKALATFQAVKADIQIAKEEAEEGEEITTEEPVEVETPKLEEVRMLAAAIVRCETDGKPNEDLGKTKLKACLNKVGAKNLTSATPKQLIEIVPLLENNAGKTLAEVVAEANA